MAARVIDEGSAVGLELEAHHQPGAANAFEQIVVIGDHLFECRTQPRCHFVDMGEERRLGDDIEHRLACCHGERIAAIGAAMRADDHALRCVFGGKAGSDRKAAADALGDRHDVGRDAILFMREQRAGAGNAALHFIEDQHQAMCVAQVAQALQKFLRRRADAAFTLDGFDEDAADRRVDGGLDGVEIVERQHMEPVGQRLEALAHLFLVGRGNRRQRAAVKGVREGQDAKLFRVARGILEAAAGLDRAFDRFGTGIGEEHRIGEGERHQSFGERRLRRHLVEVRRVHQRRCLLLDRTDKVRMAVAKQVDGDAAGEIQPLAAFGVIKITPIPAHRLDLAAAINGHQGGDRHCLISVRRQKRTPATQSGDSMRSRSGAI